MNAYLDAIEAVTNSALGFAVSWIAIRTLWPVLGWPVDGGQALGVTLMFFGLSTARSWAVRAAFRRMGRMQNVRSV